MEYSIKGITLAVREMNKMLSFYKNVFGVSFKKQQINGTTLYAGIWAGMHLLLCPAELAGNTALQNRHQFDLLVKNFDVFISLCTQYGGKLMGEVQEEDGVKKVGIYDPDNNSIVIIQSITT
ncbi:MAG: VOC family protein [Bacteroidota bacterium]